MQIKFKHWWTNIIIVLYTFTCICSFQQIHYRTVIWLKHSVGEKSIIYDTSVQPHLLNIWQVHLRNFDSLKCHDLIRNRLSHVGGIANNQQSLCFLHAMNILNTHTLLISVSLRCILKISAHILTRRLSQQEISQEQ